MVSLPAAFTQPEFPEIRGAEEFAEATLVFFDHFDYPTAEQLAIVDQLEGWSLIRWGGWTEDMEADEVDFDELAMLLEDAPHFDGEPSLDSLSLNAEGLPNGEREPQPIEQSEDINELFPEGEGWGMIAISTPSWQTVATLAWQGCMNAAEPQEMAAALEKWHARFGIKVLAFGAEEDSDTLLVRIPENSSNNQDLLLTMATAADQVNICQHPQLGQLAGLWFD